MGSRVYAALCPSIYPHLPPNSYPHQSQPSPAHVSTVGLEPSLPPPTLWPQNQAPPLSLKCLHLRPSAWASPSHIFIRVQVPVLARRMSDGSHMMSDRSNRMSDCSDSTAERVMTRQVLPPNPACPLSHPEKGTLPTDPFPGAKGDRPLTAPGPLGPL